MPLSINVGLSRKASKDYQSTGVSINVTAELDQALLARPDELQQQVANLYSQAEQALERQAGRQRVTSPVRGVTRGRAESTHDGNGTHGSRDRRSTPAPATQSQLRAIRAIAERVGTDPNLESRDMAGAELDDLNIRQASELIDHLQGLQAAGH